MPEVYGQVTLSWNANVEADLAGYQVQYGNSPTTLNFGLNVALTPTPATPSITIGGSLPWAQLQTFGTLYFAVAAYDTSSNFSPLSSPPVTMAVAPKIFPMVWPAVAFLVLLASVASAETLTWTANAEADLAGYRIYSGNMPCSAQGPMLPTGEVGKVTTYPITVPTGSTVVSARITAVDTSGNESTKSLCAEKTLSAPIDSVSTRLTALETDMAVLKAQRDALKAGWCALKGSSLTKDVLAERQALGGCP